MGANTSQEIENNQNSAKNKLRYPQVASNGRPSIQKPISKKSKQKAAELSPCDSAFRASRASSIIYSSKRSPVRISPDIYKNNINECMKNDERIKNNDSKEHFLKIEGSNLRMNSNTDSIRK